jgi:hypothetical protein
MPSDVESVDGLYEPSNPATRKPFVRNPRSQAEIQNAKEDYLEIAAQVAAKMIEAAKQRGAL